MGPIIQSPRQRNGELRGGFLLNSAPLRKPRKDPPRSKRPLRSMPGKGSQTRLRPVGQNYGAASDHLFEHLSEVSESAVSSVVPVPIIEAAKGIDIPHQRRTGCPKRRVFSKARLDGVEPWSVQQSSQPVDHR